MKKRLDIVLFERKLFNSREKAKEAIEEGLEKNADIYDSIDNDSDLICPIKYE